MTGETTELEVLSGAVDAALAAIRSAGSLDELRAVESSHLGRKSAIGRANQGIRELPTDERPEAGRRLGELRRAIQEALDARRAELDAAALAEIEGEPVDVTLPGIRPPVGHEHLLSKVTREVVEIFVGMGYHVAEGTEVETDYYNFEALNHPPDHPARSMHDTLYVDSGLGEEVLLRTHTSPVQIRVMEATEPPLFMVAPGRVFRRDTLDPTHSPVFHQIEGLAVDEGLSMCDLAGTLERFVREYFGDMRRIRMLPSFFPFTEPSVEVGMSCFACDGAGCRTCGQTGWIEILGAGMVDPNVFGAVGYDAERWTGFAFGMGIERIAMLRHGVSDIRLFYENDLRFLSQF